MTAQLQSWLETVVCEPGRLGHGCSAHSQTGPWALQILGKDL